MALKVQNHTLLLPIWLGSLRQSLGIKVEVLIHSLKFGNLSCKNLAMDTIISVGSTRAMEHMR